MTKGIKLTLFLGLLCQLVFGQVTPNINSGNPAIPFPQFLDYGPNRKSLASHNAPGVTHAEMERRTREAWQLVCNNTKPYPNTIVSGIQYLQPGAPNHCTCVEADGYYLLGAAIMGDKTYFDGYYMWAHDRAFNGVKRFIDGVTNPYGGYNRGLSYAGSFGAGTGVLGGGISGNSATDGDVDLALALLIAYKQWGEHSGIFLTNGGWGGKEINYKEEALNYIRAMVDTAIYAGALPEINYVSGVVGLDGYIKRGDSWGELTPWAVPGYKGMKPQTSSSGAHYIDYNSPAWFRQFGNFLQAQNDNNFYIGQYKRGEASSDWLMGLHYSKNPKNISYMGKVDYVSATDFKFSNYIPDGEDFRGPWRTAMNYVWHGNPTFTWNPTTHEVEENKPNTYEYDMAIRYAKFLKNNQAAPWNNPCRNIGDLKSKPLTFKGPYTLLNGYSPDGTLNGGAFPLNWIHGTGAASAIAAQDFELMGEMFRHCVIAWDAATGQNLDSRPIYFHEWFRLCGMLTLAGNFQAPDQMIARPNLKVYHKVDKTFAFTNDQLTFTVSYRNYGSVDGTGTVVKFGIPAGFQYVSSTKGSLSGDSVVWNVGTAKGFKTGALAATMDSMKVTLKVGPTASGRYCTSARVFCNNGVGWTSDEYPNNITAVMERNCVDIVKRALRIEKTASRKQVNPTTNGDVVYKIKFENSSDAGWINGGRPGVRLAFAHEDMAAPTATAANVLKYRLFHDAAEAYIDYGNYRVSYFMNDNSIKCYSGDPGCTTGWSLQNTIMEGGVKDAAKVFHETIVPGSDANGSWNQRIVLQFTPQLATITQHLQQYAGSPSMVHEGGTAALRGVWRLFTSNYSNVDWSDDWSWVAAYKDGDDGIYYPIGDDYSDPNNLGLPIDSWHKSACQTTNNIMKKVLVEEWDGYVWRRVLGNGPMPGRDITNVIVRDTLPAGVSIKNFIRQTALGVTATTSALAGGRTLITWTIPKMQINQKDSIVYTANIAGPCAEKQVVNKAWIEGNSESAISEADTITVTCNPVTICPTATTLTKNSDKTTYADGQTVKYTLSYTQTQGSIANPDLNSATDWTVQSGTGASFAAGKLTLGGGSKVAITHDYSYGTNTLGNGIEGTIQIAASENDFAIVVRNDIYIRLLSSGGSNPTLVDIYSGTTKLNATSFSIPFFAASMDFRIKLNGPTLSMWLVATGTEISGAAPITQAVPNKAGAAGVAHGILGNNPYASHTVSSWRSHMDVAYDVEITDPVPTEITSATNIRNVTDATNGTLTAGVIKWTIATGKANPVPYGTVKALSWEGTFNGCQKVTNVAYVNTRGITGNQYGVCYDVNCSNNPTCTPPTTVSITGDSLLTPSGTLVLTAVTTPIATGFMYNWYKLPNTTIPIGSGINKTTMTVSDTGRYMVKVMSATDATCFKESSIKTVRYLCEAPVIKAFLNGIALVSPYTINLCAGQSGKLSFAPQKYNFEYDIRQTAGKVLLNGVAVAAGDSAKVVVSATDAGSYQLKVYADPGNTGNQYCLSPIADLTINTVAAPTASITTTPLTYCSNQNGLTLTAQTVASASYAWFKGSAPVGTNSATLANATAGTYTVKVALGTCSATSSPATVTSLAQPVAAIDQTGAPFQYCEGKNGVTLTAQNAGSGATYQWLLGSIAQGAATTSLTRANATEGDWSVIVKAANGCSDTSNLTFVSAMRPIYEIDRIQSDTVVCAGETLTLYGPAQTSATWIAPNKTSKTAMVYTDNAPQSGYYKAVYTNAGCSVSDSILVHVNPLPLADITPKNPTYCASSNGVGLSAADAGTGATYEWFKNTTSVGAPSGNALLANATEGTYTVKVILKGCEKISSEVTVSKSANVSMTILGDTVLCPNAALTLGTSLNTSVTWTLPDKTQQSAVVLSLSAPAPGIYKAAYADQTGCTGVDSVLVRFTTPIQPTASIAEDKNNICPSESITFTATTQNETNPSYRWYVNTAVQSAIGKTFSSSTLQNGDIVKFVLFTETNCNATVELEDTVLVKVKPAIAPSIQLKAVGAKVCVGQSVTFEPEQMSGEGTAPVIAWYRDNQLVTTGSSYTTPVNTTTSVFAQLTSNAACAAPNPVNSDTLTVGTDSQVIPTVELVSPDNVACSDRNEYSFTVSNTSGGGDSPEFRFFKNGYSVVTSNTNDPDITIVDLTLIARNLNDGDLITVRMSSNSPCRTQDTVVSDAIRVTVVPKPEAKILQPVPNDGTHTTNTSPVALLAEVANLGNYVGKWEKTGEGTLTATSGESNSLTSLTVPGITEVRWIVSDPSNECSPDTAKIYVRYADGIWANAGADLAPCELSTPILRGNGSGTGVWESLTQGASISPVTTTDVSVTQKVIGLNQFRYCVTDQTQNQTVCDTVDVTVQATITPQITIQQDFTAQCEGDSVRFTAVSSAGNVIWSNGATGNQVIYKDWKNNDQVTAKLFSSETCASPNEVTSNALVVTGAPKQTLDVTIQEIKGSIPSGEVCPGSPLKLEIITNMPDLSYNWLSIDVVVDQDSLFETVAQNDFTITALAYAEGQCVTGKLSDSREVRIQLKQPDSVSIANNINGQYTGSVCEGDLVTFIANTVGTISSYKWYLNDAPQPTTSQFMQVPNLADGDEIKLEGVVQTACASSKLVDSTIVQVSAKPREGFTNGAGPVPYCLGKGTTLTSVEDNPLYAYSWTRNDTIPVGNGTSLAPQGSGKYTLNTLNESCLVSSSIEVREIGISVKALADPQTFLPGNTVELKAIVSGNTFDSPLTYAWSPAGIIHHPGNAFTQASPTQSGFVKITVTTPEGCEAKDSVELKKQDILFIPNALIPDTYDQNAYWGIKGTDMYPNLDVKVYNRWGTLVHEQKGYSKPWDGTCNGKELPTGTYYYVIKDRAFEKPFVGDVTIVR